MPDIASFNQKEGVCQEKCLPVSLFAGYMDTIYNVEKCVVKLG